MKIKTMIRVLHVRVGEDPEVREINAELPAMQALVGGYLECVQLPGGVDMWINEEGAISADPYLNFMMFGVGPIFGDVFFARHDGAGDTASLTDQDIAKLSRVFAGRTAHRAHAS